MSTEPSVIPLPATPAFAMLRTLGSAATISGLLVVLAFKLTLPYIEANQHRATQEAILHILPQTVIQLSFTITAEGLQRTRPGLTGEVIYATYNKDGVLQGVALPGAGQGYGGLIQVLYAYREHCQCITGVKVLKMAETPGFGDKMTYDPAFLKNFEALDVSLNPGGDALVNPIVAVKHGTKSKPWQIDALAGATISSRGMARALNTSAARLLPQVRKQLAVLKAAGLDVVANKAATK